MGAFLKGLTKIEDEEASPTTSGLTEIVNGDGGKVEGEHGVVVHIV